jgi:hypothetical protein
MCLKSVYCFFILLIWTMDCKICLRWEISIKGWENLLQLLDINVLEKGGNWKSMLLSRRVVHTGLFSIKVWLKICILNTFWEAFLQYVLPAHRWWFNVPSHQLSALEALKRHWPVVTFELPTSKNNWLPVTCWPREMPLARFICEISAITAILDKFQLLKHYS